MSIAGFAWFEVQTLNGKSGHYQLLTNLQSTGSCALNHSRAYLQKYWFLVELAPEPVLLFTHIVGINVMY